MSKQKKNTGESFLAGIAKLVNQILFVSNVSCQQICHEHVGKCVLPVKHFHHGLLIDPHHRAIGQCGCGAHAEWLPCEATFSEESALVQDAYCGFLSDLRDNCEYYLSFLYVKNSIGRVALSKNRLPFSKSCDCSAAVDGRKEYLGIELAEILGRYHGWASLSDSMETKTSSEQDM